jgi:hypothetical protein
MRVSNHGKGYMVSTRATSLEKHCTGYVSLVRWRSDNAANTLVTIFIWRVVRDRPATVWPYAAKVVRLPGRLAAIRWLLRLSALAGEMVTIALCRCRAKQPGVIEGG